MKPSSVTAEAEPLVRRAVTRERRSGRRPPTGTASTASPDVRRTLAPLRDAGVLTISGERKLEKEEQGKKFHRIERAYGRFVRSFVLPDNVDPTKVTASMKDGALEVRLVKAEQAKPKQIEISVN